jgi:hypothetical protein
VKCKGVRHGIESGAGSLLKEHQKVEHQKPSAYEPRTVAWAEGPRNSWGLHHQWGCFKTIEAAEV